MKDTIKEELETKYLKEDLVNDNTLLLYEQISNEEVILKMRYIANNRLHESLITKLSMEEFIAGDRIILNEDNTALIVYKKENNEDIIKTMIDLETHYKVIPDYIKVAFERKFNKNIKHYKKEV